jgi:hypothetical protein
MQPVAGRTEPFNEAAVQVKRLVARDREQMLGNKIDILDKFETEFGDPDEPSTSARPVASAAAVAEPPAASPSTSGSSSTTAAAAAPASPAAAAAPKPAAPAAVKTSFGAGGGVASPFGASSSAPGASSRTRSMMEPAGLSPDMSPDPIVKTPPTPGNLISKITLTQVVSHQQLLVRLRGCGWLVQPAACAHAGSTRALVHGAQLAAVCRSIMSNACPAQLAYKP